MDTRVIREFDMVTNRQGANNDTTNISDTDYKMGRGLLGNGTASGAVMFYNSSLVNITGSFTLVAWFSKYAHSGFQHVLLSQYAAAGQRNYSLAIGWSGASGQLTGSIANATQVTGTAVITSGVAGDGIHMAAFTYDLSSNLCSLYLDGRLDTTATSASSPLTTTANVGVGGMDTGGGGPPMNGYQKNSYIYSRCLRYNEIIALYRDPYAMFKPMNSSLHMSNIIASAAFMPRQPYEINQAVKRAASY
jgi:hypothetical protein